MTEFECTDVIVDYVHLPKPKVRDANTRVKITIWGKNYRQKITTYSSAVFLLE